MGLPAILNGEPSRKPRFIPAGFDKGLVQREFLSSELADKLQEPPPVCVSLTLIQRNTSPLDRFGEALVIDWLEQIVERWHQMRGWHTR